MSVAIFLLALILFSKLIPRWNLIKYYVFASILLSCVYFYVRPYGNSDLLRHWNFMNYIDNMMLMDVIGMKNGFYKDALAKMYLPSYPLYCLYAWLIAKLKIKELLPVITSIIVYLISAYIINDCCKNSSQSNNRLRLGLCFAFVILNYDFVSISGIRSVLGMSVFALILYFDLYKNANKKVLCFIGYFALCLFHSYCVVLLGFRLLLILYNKMTKTMIKGAVVGGVLILPRLAVNLSKSAVLGKGVVGVVVVRALSLYELYEESSWAWKFYAVIIFATYTITVAIIRKEIRRNLVVNYTNDRPYQYLLLLLIFLIPNITVSSYTSRLKPVFVILFLPYFYNFLERTHGNKLISFHSTKSEMMLQLYSYIATIIMFAAVTVFRYIVFADSISFK